VSAPKYQLKRVTAAILKVNL